MLDVILHLDRYLNVWVQSWGVWTYAVLFLIIFFETGLVVTPFLPGDSLLFAVGALAASPGSVLYLPLVIGLLCFAAILGDAINYAVGRFLGPKVFTSENSIWLNKKHLFRAQAFYDKHGGKTIILARFVPIIRTFAPFVAGIGKMQYARFAAFNVTGGIAWVSLFLIAGYFFGNLAVVKTNFHIVIFAIIFISLLPIFFEFIQARREARTGSEANSEKVPL